VIVYGDPAREVRLHAFVAWLHERCDAVSAPEPGTAVTMQQLGMARGLLIDVGRLEQAGRDHLDRAEGEHADVATALQAGTDAAAGVFCALWELTQTGCRPVAGSAVRSGVQAVRAALDQLSAEPDAPITVKTPEGFAFYTMYPEQYCVAARCWADDHAAIADRRVGVVGVRSIGTTLSAVVGAVLENRGWQVHRRTVRPVGPPFDRTVDLHPGDLGGADRAVVVDEGPGMSGSSMASVAESLEQLGVSPEHISFLPGHGRDPGPMASHRVIARWTTTSRYVGRLEDMRWCGRSLPEVLVAATSRLSGTRADVRRIDDLGGGGWRAVVYDDACQWPPVTTAFERNKWRCTLADGSAVLWKFFGADEERTTRRARALFELGWGPRPLGSVHGYVATEWIPASPSTASDAVLCLPDLAAYVDLAAGTTLDPSESSAGVARLGEVLYWNTHEAWGAAAADRTTAWRDAAARHAARTVSAAFGDGSMEPHGWLRDRRTGRLRKVGGIGHDRDHTIIGRQSVAWDVAGTIVEWDLGGSERDRFLSRVGASHPSVRSRSWMHFHELAYAAFRLGLATMAADPDETMRSSVARYRTRLVTLLGMDDSDPSD
jgi:hypothetical protein